MLQRNKTVFLAALPALLFGVGCGGSETAQAQSRSALTQVREQLGPTSLDTATAARLSGAFRGAADKALPAVVQIRVTVTRERPVASRQRFQMPFPFEGPNGDDPAPRGQGTGSGFIFDNKGYILTNNHVVEGASNVRVTLVDGREYDARVIGTDPDTDIGVIKIEPRNGEQLAVAQIGSSDQLRVGDWVLALGNPLGLDFTVTAGIVSAKGRSIRIIESNKALEAFIQTDAAINRGNSGGPLVDLLGRVVGINSAIQSPTGYYTGAGFAIPIDLARKVAGDLIEFGVVHRPRLGVQVSSISEADAEVYKLPSVAGAEIVMVEENYPAAKAGIEMGDVVVAVDGKPVRTQTEFMVELARKRPGDEVRLDFIRFGQKKQAMVKLGEFEAERPQATRPARAVDGAVLLGFRAGQMTGPLAAECGFRTAQEGVFTLDVDPTSPAAEALITPCLQIVSINGQRVNSPQDVERLARALKPGETVSLIVRSPRGQQIHNFRVSR